MTFASADILGRHLRPLCSRDNHAMKYESIGSSSNNAGNQAAYHCGFMGCSVRYNLVDGYYMLIGMPDHANPVDEPGVNTRTCPRHGCWLYRRENVTAKPGALWCCGVEGCDFGYDAKHKGRLGQDLVMVFVHNMRIRMPCKRFSARLTSAD